MLGRTRFFAARSRAAYTEKVMSDASAPQNTSQPADGSGSNVPIRLLGQFIKDFSFEVPHAPEIFGELRQRGPEIPISLDTAVRHLSDNTFEVTMTLHIEAALGPKKAFILELTYGAVVDINTQVVPEEHLHPVLLIEVPRQMFPFVRQIVGDVTVNGGFPPLLLQVIDFADLYGKKFGDAPQSVNRNAPQPAVH
jgi:preprotein translocase subunit SecB